MLPDDIGPARLIATRESDEASPAREMVQDRRILGNPERVLRTHHVTELPDPDVLGYRRPVGIENSRIRPHFVAFRPEMVLDTRNAPKPQFIADLDDVMPTEQGFLIAFAIASDRPQRSALLLTRRGYDRIELQNHLHHDRPSLTYAGYCRPSLSSTISATRAGVVRRMKAPRRGPRSWPRITR